MFGFWTLSNCRSALLVLLAALSPVGARANSIYAPAEYYGAQQLSGNLGSANGLWVADPNDPLAYIYGYIPGIEKGGAAPYFGSGNFGLIPVLLADPTAGLQTLSMVLGATSLPKGGSVLDISAAVAAFELSQHPATSPNASESAPEPLTFWLFALSGLALVLYRRPLQTLVKIK